MLVIKGILGCEMWWWGFIYLSDNLFAWLRQGIEYRFPNFLWVSLDPALNVSLGNPCAGSGIL